MSRATALMVKVVVRDARGCFPLLALIWRVVFSC
jgi:hypothetical protein